MMRLALRMLALGLSICVLAAGVSAAERPIVVNVNFTQPFVPPNVPPTAPTKTELGYVAMPVDMGMPPLSPLNKTGLACYTNRNSPGCSNLRNDLRFIFGSCRDFFGEPCLPHPNATGRGISGMKGSSIFGGSSSCACT